MLSASQVEYIKEWAYVPEHLLEYVVAVSGAEPFLHDDYLCYYQRGHLTFIGYPLKKSFEATKAKKIIGSAIKEFKPYEVTYIGPEVLGLNISCLRSTSDYYYKIELSEVSISQKIRSTIKQASRRLYIEKSQEFTNEHIELISEFISTHTVDDSTQYIFKKIPNYISSSKTAWVFSARNKDKTLIAFDIADFGAKDYAFYMFNFISRKNYVSGASDLLLFEVIKSAEEKGKIIFDVENASGAGKGFGVVAVAILSKNIDVKLDERVNIGDVEPGEKKTVEINVSASIDVPTTDVAINIRVDEETGFSSEPKQIVFKTEAVKPPVLEIAKIEIDDKFYPDREDKLSVGNGDGIIQPGESVEVMLTLINKGLGATKNSLASVKTFSNEVTFRSKITDIELGNIMPGEWREIKYTFSIPKIYSGPDVLKFALNVLDERKKFSVEIPFSLTIGKRYEKIEVVKIEGKPLDTKPVVVPTFGDELLTLPTVQQHFVSQDAVGVVIGVKNYKHKDVPEVEYALRDVSLVKEYFVNVIGIPKENIIYLENPTQGDFMRVFGTKDDYKGQLYHYVKPNKSDIFIYYTGHGAPDIETKSAYFVPSDCHPNYVKLNGYSLDLFYENLSKIPARSITVVIDACFSGASERGMLIAKASPLIVTPVTGKFIENMNIFTSASGDEISSWYPEKRHSLFTYFFLRALQGEADKDKNKSLSFGEIEDYVKENVSFLARKMYGRKQTPKFIGDRNKIIVRYQ